jgi:hypothetical protein
VADAGVDRTEIRTAVLEQRVVVERRRSDGMTWLRIGEPDPGTSMVATVALDPEEAWAVACALLSDTPPAEAPDQQIGNRS